MSEYCPSLEEETADESAGFISTEESEGCSDIPDHCLTHQHQCKPVVHVSSVQSDSLSGSVTHRGPESQVAARSAPQKRKRTIPVGIVMPNEIGFMELSQLEKFVDSINRIRGCKTSKCDGNLVPICVKSVGLGGGISICFGCNGCRSKQAVFETYSKYKPGGMNAISVSVQMAFIMAGCTHAVYAKTLSRALGIKAVSNTTFYQTIERMYPVVKDVLDRMCEIAKRDMKAKGDDELGSWKRAVTTADGTWQTRGWHSKNATFSVRNYLNGALLYYHHLCQKGSDNVVEGGLYRGTSKSAEGYAASITFQRAKEEGMEVAIHWQDADSSSAKAVREVYPEAQIMMCGGHSGRAHRKMLEKHQKDKVLSQTQIEKYRDTFPNVYNQEYQKCKCRNHACRSGCGCLTDAFIAKAHTNLSSILMKAQSQEEYAKHVKALARHAVDDHSQCDSHPLVTCSCGACKNKEVIKCKGKAYKTRFQLSCKFHALLYEIECHERASQAEELIHPVLKRGHSNAMEASHNVFIRFRSKDISLQRLHYHVSTNLGLLQANLTYMHAKFGTKYHWIPEVYRRMGLPVFEGVQEALERQSLRRKRMLEYVQTTPVKRRRIELKKMRVEERIRRSEWSKKYGHGHTYGSDDEEEPQSGEVVSNQHKRSKGATKACSACGSSTHKRPTHRDCPFNTAAVLDSEGTESSVAGGSSAPSSESESDFGVEPSIGGLCTCGSSGRAHKRECPLNLRRRFPGSSVPPSTCMSPSSKPVPIKEKKPSSTRPQMKVGDHVCVHRRFMGSSHLPCRIVGEFDGRYQLYCTKGILTTSFCATELTPLASGPVISLENWREAPRVSLRSAADGTRLIECSNCDVLSSFDGTVISSASEGESEASEVWVNNGAYTLSRSDEEIILSPTGWLTDNIVDAAQTVLLQFYPGMAGLQPPVLQKTFAFQVHSGEFVQIVHIRNNHWCVVSSLGCESGMIRVYDSLYKTPSKDLVHLIANMVHIPLSELKIVLMDVEKQSNGSDCGVLAIAYAFDICSGLDPCAVRFDHSKIRQHLATCLENCQLSRFPIAGERKSVSRKPKVVELHCSCRMPEEEGDQMAMCDSCNVWYHRHCMDIPSEVFGESEVHWECKRCTRSS